MSATLGGGDQIIHVSGQVATDHLGHVLCRDDPAGQAEVVFYRDPDGHLLEFVAFVEGE